ncbi:S-layer homology domain-containing protein [Paenibacillus nanensis]|uniref:S-layer homology domain-containing protein n=1 Tax=Paenibacillus nanensis TaxID=393251 RepID=UPI0013C2E7DF|nr:S-layer homology domain-containing protein [Paenibacillus nanensis]
MNNSKRFVMLGLFALWITVLLPAYAAAEQQQAFRLAADKNGSLSAHEIKIDVRGESLQDVYAYEVKLSYDPAKLRFKSASSGAVAGFSIKPQAEDGQVVFASTKTGQKKGESGSFILCSLVFEAVGTGNSEVKLTSVKLVDSALKALENKPSVKLGLELAGPVFKDIQGHWAEAAVIRAAQSGFVKGYSDGTFRPEAQVTRAEFAVMLARALELPAAAESVSAFADSGSIPVWAQESIDAAVQAGVLKGYDDGTFQPERLITRSEVAVMVARALGLAAEANDQSSFADRLAIPAWAEPSVAAAVEAGIVKGRGGNRFAPDANTTRAEAVTLLLAAADSRNAK